LWKERILLKRRQEIVEGNYIEKDIVEGDSRGVLVSGI